MPLTAARLTRVIVAVAFLLIGGVMLIAWDGSRDAEVREESSHDATAGGARGGRVVAEVAADARVQAFAPLAPPIGEVPVGNHAPFVLPTKEGEAG